MITSMSDGKYLSLIRSLPLLFIAFQLGLMEAANARSGPEDAVVVEQLKASYALPVRIPLLGGFVNDVIVVREIRVVDRRVEKSTATIIAEMTFVCIKPIGNMMRESEAGSILTGRAIKCAAGETGTFRRRFGFDKYESGWRLGSSAAAPEPSPADPPFEPITHEAMAKTWRSFGIASESIVGSWRGNRFCMNIRKLGHEGLFRVGIQPCNDKLQGDATNAWALKVGSAKQLGSAGLPVIELKSAEYVDVLFKLPFFGEGDRYLERFWRGDTDPQMRGPLPGEGVSVGVTKAGR